MKGLLFITHQTEKYTYLQSVEIALLGGCRQIQLRMKNDSLSGVELVAKGAKILCDKYNAHLYIDDYVEICKDVGAAGVHLGKLDMPIAEARKILGNSFIIGGTANTFEDVKHLSEVGVDYIGLGPFRFTSTKNNLSPILELKGYQHIVGQCQREGVKLPILAIGGITLIDIQDIMETGVSGIAISSAILNASDPVLETKRIVNMIDKYIM